MGWMTAVAVVGVVVGWAMRRLLTRLARSGPIPPGWCEVGSAAAGALVTAMAGPNPALLALAWWSVALAVIDLHERRLPDALTLTGAVAAMTFAAVTGRGGAAVLGALTLFVLYLLVHLARPAALGGGDVKLAIPIGAMTGAAGPPTWLLAAILAAATTAVAGLAALALRRRGARIAHGPAMCAGAVLALVAVS